MPLRAKHLAVPVSIIAGVGAALVTSAVAQSGGSNSAQDVPPFSKTSPVVTLQATLTGQDEAKGANPAGDLNAEGNVIISVNTTTNEVCANLTTDVGEFVGFHIHQGDLTNRVGPIVVDFGVSAAAPATAPFSKCVTDTDAPAIAANPNNYYANVHTATFPTGAISGQLDFRAAETQLLNAPVRVYDTRFNTAGKFQPTETRVIDLSVSTAGSPSGIPIGARAAIVTVTVTRSSGNGFLTVFSSSLATAPDTSNVNFGSTQDIANNITVATDGSNKIKIHSGTEPVTEDVVVDVVGYIL